MEPAIGQANELRLYHELLLLSLDDKTGTPESRFYPLAISAAVIAELVIEKRIKIGAGINGKVTVSDETPTGASIMEKYLRRIARSKKAKPLSHWLQSEIHPDDLVGLVAKELCAKGILKRVEKTFLWVFPKSCFIENKPEPEAQVKSRLTKLLFEDEPNNDERTFVLAALANAVGLLEPNFGVIKVKRARKKIDDKLTGSALGKDVKTLIKNIEMTEQTLLLTSIVLISAAS